MVKQVRVSQKVEELEIQWELEDQDKHTNEEEITDWDWPTENHPSRWPVFASRPDQSC